MIVPDRFTAARIAEKLGRTKRGVLKALDGIAPAGEMVQRGGKAAVWILEQLPEAWREKLAELARASCCRNGEHFLSDATPTWEPRIGGEAVKLSDLEERCIADAQRLQRALLPALTRLTGSDYTPDSEAERRAFAEYRRVCGKCSAEHFRRLIRRTVDRAGVARDFSRTELFLPEDRRLVRRAARTPAALPCAGALQAAISLVWNAKSYTLADRANLWDAATEEIQFSVDRGSDERAARAAVLKTLADLTVALAPSREALQKALQRKWERWTRNGGRPGANKDRRKGRSGKCHGSPFTEKDYELTAAALMGCGGRFGQAYRELYNAGKYSPTVYQTYAFSHAEKWRVPKPLRARFNADFIAELLKHHQGPKEAKLHGPKCSRDWSAMPSGVQAQSDDLTPPNYFYLPLPDGGFKLLRGQFLPWIDTRTTYIHCFQLLPTESYGSVDICRGLVKLNDEFGMPEELYLESGVWRRSLLIAGRGDEVPFKERVYGLRDLGIRIIHALDPSAKVVEYVFGLLQNRMERERGYCGRDERRDCPEAMIRAKREVESGKCHPSKYFYSYAEWVQRLNEICNAYNDEVQGGKKIGGLSPRQAFVKYLNTPPMRLDETTRYLLANHRRVAEVKGTGLTITIGKTPYTYKSEEIGKRIGQRVLAWFDLEDPSLITVTTLDCKHPFTVARETIIPAYRAPREIIAQSKRENAAHVAPVKQLYSKLKKEYPEEVGGTIARRVVTDAATRELGAKMGEQKATMKAAAERTQRTRRAVADKSARAGLRLPSTNNPQELEAQRRLAELMIQDAGEHPGDE